MIETAAKERARIVAWLRELAHGYRNRRWTTDPGLPYLCNELGLAAGFADRFADLIEQGNEAFVACETLLEGTCRDKRLEQKDRTLDAHKTS